LLNSANFYGTAEDPLGGLKLLGRFFDAHPDYVDKTVLMVKGGGHIPSYIPSGE
jgi:hypothetical protein